MSTQRIISIYSSRGGAKKIVTGATETKMSNDKKTYYTTDVVENWGGLIPFVKKLDYPVGDLHVSESTRKSTLEHVDAVLPEGDFTLFMRPKKTKSGAKKRADGLDKKGLVALLKEDITSSENGKVYYNGYSSKTVVELSALVNKFKAKVAKAAAPAKKVAGPVKKAVAKVVKSVADKKVAKVEEVVEETQHQLERRLEQEAKDFERGLK